MNRPICRYCRCDALEPMSNMALYRCLVCLRVESVEESLARRHRESGGVVYGGIPVVSSPFVPDGQAFLLDGRVFLDPLTYRSLIVRLVNL